MGHSGRNHASIRHHGFLRGISECIRPACQLERLPRALAPRNSTSRRSGRNAICRGYRTGDLINGPQYESRVSLGNVISIIGTLLTAAVLGATLLIWGGKQDQRMMESERRIESNARTIAAAEVRLRSVENRGERQDVMLQQIIESLREIKNALKEQRP